MINPSSCTSVRVLRKYASGLQWRLLDKYIISGDKNIVDQKLGKDYLQRSCSRALRCTRRQMLKTTIADIISSIQERKELLKEAVDAFHKRECEVKTLIMSLDPLNPTFGSDATEPPITTKRGMQTHLLWRRIALMACASCPTKRVIYRRARRRSR